MRKFFAMLLAALLAGCPAVAPVPARDVGQWEDNDPDLKAWYSTLMQPDNPHISCCGEADAYWADKHVIEGDKVYAIITDERPDAPLGRPHVEIGTRVFIPNNKIKFDRGNPTGHTIVFMRAPDTLFCYVPNGGV